MKLGILKRDYMECYYSIAKIRTIRDDFDIALEIIYNNSSKFPAFRITR